jgi:TPR repeat protein
MPRLLATSLLLISSLAVAGPGQDAYESGDYKRALQILEPQAKRGLAEAQFLLARMREEGHGIDKDITRAIFWYTQAAAQGHVQARAALALLRDASPLLRGAAQAPATSPTTGNAANTAAPASTSSSAATEPSQTAPRSPVGGPLWAPPSTIAAAAPAVSAEARQLTAMMSGQAPFDRSRANRAVDALKARAPQDPASASLLGQFFESREGGEDYAEAARWYKSAAERGDAVAQNNLGALHHDGKGVPRSDADALRLYSDAARTGYAIAQYNYALMLGRGRGTVVDVSGMLEWLRKSSAQNYPRAQAQLARLLLDGAGATQDEKEAARLFSLAAQQGLPQAQYWYGQLLMSGRGVNRNIESGADWILKAADGGVPLALLEGAGLFETGIGRPVDNARALVLYRRAVDAGVKDAAQRLATAYTNGELGLAKDAAEAQRWAERAK